MKRGRSINKDGGQDDQAIDRRGRKWVHKLILTVRLIANSDYSARVDG